MAYQDEANICTTSTVSPAGKGSASQAGVTRAGFQRPSIRHPDVTRCARSRLSQSPLSYEGDTSDKVCVVQKLSKIRWKGIEKEDDDSDDGIDAISASADLTGNTRKGSVK